jgi:ribosomal protein L44E
VTEHYTRNTESILKWCNKCARLTVHKVSGGRVGRCSEHQAEDTQAQQKAREKARQRAAKDAEPRLF